MKEKQLAVSCLICTKAHFIIFKGTRPAKNQIQMVDKPGFFDALQLSKFGLQNSPYQFIPLSNQVKEHYLLPHKTKLHFNKKSISIEGIPEPQFDYFLIKKGNKVLFLAERPREKMDPLKTNQMLAFGEEKGLDE